jgi:predicted MFS family arabinose efflux permease
MAWFSMATYSSAAIAAAIGTALASSPHQWSWGNGLSGMIAVVCLSLFLFHHTSVRRTNKSQKETKADKLPFIIVPLVASGVGCCHLALFTYLPQVPMNNGAEIGGLAVTFHYIVVAISGILLVPLSNKLGDLRTLGFCLLVMMLGRFLIVTGQTPLILLAGIVFGVAVGPGMICLKQIVFDASGKRAIGVAIPNVMSGLGQFGGAVGFAWIKEQWGFNAIWFTTLPILITGVIFIFILYVQASNRDRSNNLLKKKSIYESKKQKN